MMNTRVYGWIVTGKELLQWHIKAHILFRQLNTVLMGVNFYHRKQFKSSQYMCEFTYLLNKTLNQCTHN